MNRRRNALNLVPVPVPGIMSQLEPTTIVMMGDYLDGPPPMPDLTGKRLVILPDIHVPVSRRPVAAVPADLADLFAVSRWPGKPARNGKAAFGLSDDQGKNRSTRRKDRSKHRRKK